MTPEQHEHANNEPVPSTPGPDAGQPAAEAAPEQADDPTALKALLEEEKNKAQSYLANWQRAQADYINFKRRIEQERDELAKFSSAMLISQLLPIIDDLERAFGVADATLAGLTWVDGIKLVYRKLVATLESQGVKAMRTVGEPFDPRYHQAIQYVESADEGKVVQEMQKGYLLHDRVLRPAMVLVGKKQESPAEGPPAPAK
ncbi:MAG: nucleotide exchange factor GrpE [Chloroflexi bacterium]|nr:nucleotide exchange factor GrpE [Chloroflexota bacterium]